MSQNNTSSSSQSDPDFDVRGAAIGAAIEATSTAVGLLLTGIHNSKDPLAGGLINNTPFQWSLGTNSPKVTHGELREGPSAVLTPLDLNGADDTSKYEPSNFTTFSVKSVGSGSEFIAAYHYGRYLLVVYVNNPGIIGKSFKAGAWMKGISGDWEPASKTAKQEAAAVGTNPEKYSDLIKSKEYGAVVSTNGQLQVQSFGKFEISVQSARDSTRLTLDWSGDWP